MNRWKRSNLLSRIPGKLRRILRPIFYNGSSVTSKERDTAKSLQAVLLELKNIKLINNKDDSVPT
ncbi:hypothetical protein SAMN03080594_101536 [Arenibacter palladensis]|uniref:Uncharacterized protein n=1 Tax=Arenibacter palladensis TaxID=237373 RepID=A0A1M4U9F3_9FLAO|nr:hypothetical protein [Arenibacter palladensis]SHE53193.1 hypothetical protein SAMN03080594_101536 [Arenibacter palladensis]